MGDSSLGKFIVIEGIDGAGTTTQRDLLCGHLKECGVPVVATQEPSHGHIGQLIRRVLSGSVQVDNKTLGLLFTADRMDHLATIIIPALVRGDWVVSDRYYYSTFVYQTVSEEVDDPEKVLEWLVAVNRFCRVPDLVLMIDTPVELAASRVAERQDKEIFDQLDFQRRLARVYSSLGEDLPGLFKLVDGAGSKQQVMQNLLSGVRQVFDI